jgi:Protein of unknown function (DUF3631)
LQTTGSPTTGSPPSRAEPPALNPNDLDGLDGPDASVASATASSGFLRSPTDRPWPTFDRGRWITPAGIARMLRPYGIGSETIRFGEDTAKGYRHSAFEDAFARYLPFKDVTA